MRDRPVREVMIPLAEYATVGPEASLGQVVAALDAAKDQPGGYRHLSVLVVDAAGAVRGKLSPFSFLKALEPAYLDPEKFTAMGNWGFDEAFIARMLRDQGMFEAPLDHLCAKAARKTAGEILEKQDARQVIDADTGLAVAVHMFLMDRAEHLLVTRAGAVVGVLRLVDVFGEVLDAIRTCPAVAK